MSAYWHALSHTMLMRLPRPSKGNNAHPMTIQDALTFAKDYPTIFSLITFITGLIVGNKQALGRDKRKEFNEMSQPAFAALNKQLTAIANGRQGESVGDLLFIESYTPLYKRACFRRHLNQYRDAHQGVSIYDFNTSSVSLDTKKLAHLATCARKLSPYLRRR